MISRNGFITIAVLVALIVLALVARPAIDHYMASKKVVKVGDVKKVPKKSTGLFPRWFDDSVLGIKPTPERAIVNLPAPMVSTRQSRFNGKNMESYEIRMEMMIDDRVMIQNNPSPDFLVLNTPSNCRKLSVEYRYHVPNFKEKVVEIKTEKHEVALDTLDQATDVFSAKKPEEASYWCEDDRGIQGNHLEVIFHKKLISSSRSITDGMTLENGPGQNSLTKKAMVTYRKAVFPTAEQKANILKNKDRIVKSLKICEQNRKKSLEAWGRCMDQTFAKYPGLEKVLMLAERQEEVTSAFEAVKEHRRRSQMDMPVNNESFLGPAPMLPPDSIGPNPPPPPPGPGVPY